MRPPRTITPSTSLAAAAALGGGITAATATSSPASSRPATSQHAAATVRTAQAAVGGKTETILVNGQGLPLYYYVNDTAASSLVTGGLAAPSAPATSSARAPAPAAAPRPARPPGASRAPPPARTRIRRVSAAGAGTGPAARAPPSRWWH